MSQNSCHSNCNNLASESRLEDVQTDRSSLLSKLKLNTVSDGCFLEEVLPLQNICRNRSPNNNEAINSKKFPTALQTVHTFSYRLWSLRLVTENSAIPGSRQILQLPNRILSCTLIILFLDVKDSLHLSNSSHAHKIGKPSPSSFISAKPPELGLSSVILLSQYM